MPYISIYLKNGSEISSCQTSGMEYFDNFIWFVFIVSIYNYIFNVIILTVFIITFWSLLEYMLSIFCDIVIVALLTWIEIGFNSNEFQFYL